MDCEFSCIKLSDLNLCVISMYRSPRGNLKTFLENFEIVIKRVISKGELIIVCGDFNVEMVKANNSESVCFSNLLRSLNLFCTFTAPTRNDSCIDNILVNFSKDLYNVTSFEGLFADHVPLLLNVNISNLDNPLKNNIFKNTFTRKQSEENVEVFIKHLKNEKWEMVNDFKCGKINVSTLFDSFLKTYVYLWHFSSPLIIKRVNINKAHRKKKKIKWYNSELAKEREQMLGVFNIYKSMLRNRSGQTQLAYKAYLACKKNYRIHLIAAKKTACENYINKAQNKCKAAWEIITHEHSPTCTKDALLDPEVFNRHFINSVEELTHKIPDTNSNIVDLLGTRPIAPESFQWEEVTPEELIKIVAKFSNSKSTDFYWISNYILKRTIEIIKEPLAYIISKCLEFGYFSDLLKVSKITPVFKKGDKNLPQNYRPISILPILSKILECVMHKQLNFYFETNNLFTECQYGFRTDHSTISAVMKISCHTLEAFEKKESVSLSLLDLSKAFDCVPFNSILTKLEFYGISKCSMKIIEKYLFNRKQYVSLRGTQSSMLDFTLGIPQGSVLGPFFFLVIINDLPKSVNVNSVIYADDTTLFSSDRNLDSLELKMDMAQRNAKNWFTTNKLVCNQEKTQHLLLSLSQKSNESVKLLGIQIDTRLNWNEHIQGLSKKLSRISYLFWKLRGILSIEYLRSAYFGLFQSHIAYGVILWGHSASVCDLLIIQKKVVRTICHAASRDHCKGLFTQLKILTIVNLYIFHILMYTKTNFTSFFTRNKIHEYNTRNSTKLDIPQHRLTKFGSSFKVNSIRFFNRLPITAQITPLKNFKNKLYNWLIDHPFYSISEFMEINIDIQF